MNTRLAIIALSSAAALAGQSGVAFELDPDLTRFLQLTPSQVAAILNNDREFNSTIRPRREQRLTLEAALAIEEARPRPNPVRLGEIEAEIERIRRHGLARRDDALKRNRDILTAAQRELLRPRLANPTVDWDLWEEAFFCGLVPMTRDKVWPFLGQSLANPVSAAIQLYLGLSERQAGALNSISADYRVPLAQRLGSDQERSGGPRPGQGPCHARRAVSGRSASGYSKPIATSKPESKSRTRTGFRC